MPVKFMCYTHCCSVKITTPHKNILNVNKKVAACFYVFIYFATFINMIHDYLIFLRVLANSYYVITGLTESIIRIATHC